MKNIFKKSISILLTLLILISIAPTSVVTYAGDTVDSGDGITWSFDGETLVVGGSGELSSTYTSTEEWKSMQNKCASVLIEGDVTIIGDNAFKGFTAVKKVEVASQLETVGKYAFSDCTAIEEINLPDSVTVIGDYAFSGCTALKDFQFPENLIKINKWAFKGCNCFDNKALVLPDTLQKVALGAFSGANITSLTAPFVGVGVIRNEDSLTSYNIGYMFGNMSFTNSYVCRDGVLSEFYYMPNSLKEVTVTKYIYDNNFVNAKRIEKIVLADTVETTYIPYALAKNCQALKTFVIENPDKITKIYDSAFDCCYALQEFTIPQNVTEIGYRAFALCGFKSIEITQNVEAIGGYAFFKCTGITSVVIPDSVTSIGEYAFKGCSNLKNVKLPSTYYSIGEGAFDETQYTGKEQDFVITEDGELIEYRGSDTEVVVPDGVTSIGTTFSGKTEIKTIVIPEGVLYISKNAFKGCRNLTEVVIPDTVLEIGNRAFEGCCGITELIIPNSVVEIQAGAFAGMCSLEKLTVPFVGKNREVKSDTEEAIIGYWFDDFYYSGTDSFKGCAIRPNYVAQTYNNGKYTMHIYKPGNLKCLTITDSVVKANSLNNFELVSLTLGENIKGIEKYAADKSGIEELYMDENIKLTDIPDYAFSNNNLISVTLPPSIRTVGEAFICDDATKNKLTEINLNEGLEVIEGSFWGSKITSIDFPDSLIEIRGKAFFCCQKLEYVEFPENLKEIGSFAFYRAGVKEVVFSESITYIHDNAFRKCPLVKVVVPESLKGIVDKTFGECEELEIVVIGGNVTEIGSQTFADCPSLETVVIPDSVTSISEDAFANASENMVIYCNEGSYAQEYAIQNNIKYTTLVLDAIPNQTYTGKAIEPVVKAKANNRQLVLNTEYKLSYSDNINVGVAGVTAKGLGDFKHLVAKGQFNILACQLSSVTINYQDFAIYSPGGIEPEISIYIGDDLLSEGVDYELLGLDKINGVGTYNIAIKGKGNLRGTQNLILYVLPKNINDITVITIGGLKVSDSGYTLVEGVDYTVEERTNEMGATETYVVGMGNYSDEKRISTTENSSATSFIYRILDLIKSLLSKIFGVFG